MYVLKCLIILIQGDLNIWIYGDIKSSLKEFIEYGIRNHENRDIKFNLNKFIQELTKLGQQHFFQISIK